MGGAAIFFKRPQRVRDILGGAGGDAVVVNGHQAGGGGGKPPKLPETRLPNGASRTSEVGRTPPPAGRASGVLR